jgi:hypothetical protein
MIIVISNLATGERSVSAGPPKNAPSLDDGHLMEAPLRNPDPSLVDPVESNGFPLAIKKYVSPNYCSSLMTRKPNVGSRVAG